MAITFPRDMPSQCQIEGEIPFKLRYQQSRALAGNGSPQAVEVGDSVWVAQWKVTLLDPVAAGAWSAWLSTLRGGLRTFKGRPRRVYPFKYPRGFGGLLVGAQPFSGSGVLASIGGSRASATVSGLPVGFVIQPGDYFSIPVGTKQHLHRVTDGAVAAANGTAAVSFEPRLNGAAVAGVAVLFAGPWCDMVMETPPSESIGFRGGSIMFDGIQVVI